MNIRISIFCLAVSLMTTSVYAQQAVNKTTKTPQDNAKPIEYNLTDKKNRRQGTWILRQEALRGEPAMTSVGKYLDNRKTGTWYNFDQEGKPISILKYKKDVLDGESKYFENGMLVCVGNWRGLNPDEPVDTIWVYNPETDQENQVVISTERGTLQHGLWKYYHPESGQLIKEEVYQVGELLKVKQYNLQEGLSDEQKKAIEAELLHNQNKPIYKPRKVNPNKTK